MHGPQGVANSIICREKFYHNFAQGQSGTTYNMIEWNTNTSGSGSGPGDMDEQFAVHDGTPFMHGIVVGTGNPYEYTNGAASTESYNGMDELAKIWPNITVHAMEVKMHLTFAPFDWSIKGRYFIAYRWLRNEDTLPATISLEEIKKDPSWNRTMIWPIDSRTAVSARSANEAMAFDITAFAKWSDIYPDAGDDSFELQRIDNDETGKTHIDKPTNTMIFQYNIFNSEGLEAWGENVAVFIKFCTELYYELDRYTGPNVFLEPPS